MDSSTLFARIRDLNVFALAETVRAHPDAHVEPTFITDEGEIAVSGPFGLPCRADVIPVVMGEPGDSVMVTPKTALSFEPVEIQKPTAIPVIVSPFGWDQVSFSATMDPAASLDPLLEWFWRWFDANDDNDIGHDGLCRVVHYMSDPAFEGDELKFVADLGSAPVDALNELISVLIEMGAREVKIAHPKPAHWQ